MDFVMDLIGEKASELVLLMGGGSLPSKGSLLALFFLVLVWVVRADELLRRWRIPRWASWLVLFMLESTVAVLLTSMFFGHAYVGVNEEPRVRVDRVNRLRSLVPGETEVIKLHATDVETPQEALRYKFEASPGRIQPDTWTAWGPEEVVTGTYTAPDAPPRELQSVVTAYVLDSGPPKARRGSGYLVLPLVETKAKQESALVGHLLISLAMDKR